MNLLINGEVIGILGEPSTSLYGWDRRTRTQNGIGGNSFPIKKI